MGCSQSKEVVETVKPQPPEVPAKIPEEQVVMVPVKGLSMEDDSSTHSNSSSFSVKSLSRSMKHSVSAVGLDTMNEVRREEGNLTSNCIPFELPFGRPIEEVYDGVHDGEVLGSGISGIVRLVKHKATGHKYAVKCLDLDLIGTIEGLEQLREEIYIMCQLDHPNIIRLEEVYESHNEIFLVQELCLGGELFDRLDEQPDYHYTESQCANLVKQMLCSVRYLHSKGIVHRDLKLENFLFANTAADSELKMIDFGLSKHFEFGEVHTDAVGTPYTVAPEVIRGSYDARCDLWGIGVITYLLLSGDPPFGGCGGPESLQVVRENILRGNFKYEPEEIWANVSQQAKEFINSLLVTDATKRPDAANAQKLPWIKEFSDRKSTGKNNLNPNVVRSLVAFKEFSDMRKLLCEVLSYTLLPHQIQNLRDQFEVLDKEGSGEVSLHSLKSVLKSSAGEGNLGALSEKEIEDIFNAMRVRESETTIHWHEFIAAGLSQCHVDDRNLRLAFDRMDVDHKGFINFKNVLNLLGSDGCSEERVRRMYFDGLQDDQINDLHMTYDDFLAVMKGQSAFELESRKLDSVIETQGKLGVLVEAESPLKVIETLPPLSESHSAEMSLPTITPPESPIDKISQSPNLQRGRSISAGNEAEISPSIGAVIVPAVPSNSRRVLYLPEHDHDDENIEQLIRDESKTALVVNRNLYRAHRQMRQAVLDASRRLEEAQMRRLVKEEEKKMKSNISVKMNAKSAGLVMRRGEKEQMSTEQVRKILEERQKEQQEQLAKANKQAGRGKRRRKKTVSDMTGMFGAQLPAPNKHSESVRGAGGLSCPPSPAFQQNKPTTISEVNGPLMPTLTSEGKGDRKKREKGDSDSKIGKLMEDQDSPAVAQKDDVQPTSVPKTSSWPPPPPL